MTEVPLPELLVLLRKHGVQRFAQGDLRVDFAPPEGKPMGAADLKALGATDDSEKCGCGHQPWQHTNGLCAMGCDVEKCMPPEAAP